MDTSYLAQQVNTIVGQLHGLFDEIGVPNHERDAREEEVRGALSSHHDLHLPPSLMMSVALPWPACCPLTLLCARSPMTALRSALRCPAQPGPSRDGREEGDG